MNNLSLTLYLSEVNTDNFKMIRILVGRGEPYCRSFRHRVRGLGDGSLEAAALREDADRWVLVCSISWNFTCGLYPGRFGYWSSSSKRRHRLVSSGLFGQLEFHLWSVSWEMGQFEVAALQKTQIGEFWSVRSVEISPVVCILGDGALRRHILLSFLACDSVYSVSGLLVRW